VPTHQQIVDGLSAYEHPLYRLPDDADDSSVMFESSGPEPEEDVNEAHVISSAIKGEPDMHTIMLDLDVPTKLVPSSTPGHSHLYIDVALSRDSYRELLKALRRAGVIQPGFENQLKRRGFTSLRLPWVKKENKEEAPF
jgi:hypothetical protein